MHSKITHRIASLMVNIFLLQYLLRFVHQMTYRAHVETVTFEPLSK